MPFSAPPRHGRYRVHEEPSLMEFLMSSEFAYSVAGLIAVGILAIFITKNYKIKNS
jgi:hypothetical protein